MSLMGNIYGFLGYYNHGKGRLDKAKVFYDRAQASGVNKPNFILAHGVLMLGQGNFDKAKELFRTVLVDLPTKDKQKIMAKQNISLAYWKLGDLHTAIEMMEGVHRKHKSGRVYGALGYYYIEAGDLDKALEYNLEALEYDDEDSVVLDNLGQTYLKMDNFDKAKEFFLRAEEENPDQVVTLYHLGLIYIEEGNMDLAKEKLNRALSSHITPLSTVTYEDIEKSLRDID